MVAAALAVCSAVVLGPPTDLHHLDSPAAVGLRFGSGCASTTASPSSWRVHAEAPALPAVCSREFDGDARLSDAEGAGGAVGEDGTEPGAVPPWSSPKGG